MTKRRVEYSFDDGHQLDIKLAEWLMERGLTGTFYIPSNCELEEQQIKWLADKGMTIGGHTVSHPIMRELTYEMQLWEAKNNREWLQEVTGQPVLSFAYPKGKYDETTIKAVKAAGFAEARTTNVLSVGDMEDPFRTHTTIHIHPERREYEGRPLLGVAEEQIKTAGNNTIRVWGHSWEIERYNLWDEFDQIVKMLT